MTLCAEDCVTMVSHCLFKDTIPRTEEEVIAHKAVVFFILE